MNPPSALAQFISIEVPPMGEEIDSGRKYPEMSATSEAVVRFTDAVMRETAALFEFGTLATESGNDAEVVHGRADDILLEFLDKTFPKLSAEWRKAQDRVGGFWYA